MSARFNEEDLPENVATSATEAKATVVGAYLKDRRQLYVGHRLDGQEWNARPYDFRVNPGEMLSEVLALYRFFVDLPPAVSRVCVETHSGIARFMESGDPRVLQAKGERRENLIRLRNFILTLCVAEQVVVGWRSSPKRMEKLREEVALPPLGRRRLPRKDHTLAGELGRWEARVTVG